MNDTAAAMNETADELLALVSKGQTGALDALTKAIDATALKGQQVQQAADALPSPLEATRASFAFAGSLLDQQRVFAERLLETLEKAQAKAPAKATGKVKA